MSNTKLLISAAKTVILTGTGDDLKVMINDAEYEFDPGKSMSEEEKSAMANKFKRDEYRKVIKTNFENLIILSGAGTSVGWDGKTMSELWDEVETYLGKKVIKEFCEKVGHDPNIKDLEKLLSRANIAKEFISPNTFITEQITKCEETILKNCRLTIKPNAPHIEFLNKITNRKLKEPRVKLFTLNYDTLFEQAAIECNCTLIDGFSFSFPRTFSGRNYDYDIVYREKSRIKEEESFVPKVLHLYKPHGSVNWERVSDNDGIIVNNSTHKPLMIYPKDSKYENSYEQPYFEMMSRFQQNLRKDNVLLICIGFSFHDKHLVTAIKEAVSQNPSFSLLIISRTIRDDEVMAWFIDIAKRQSNVTIVAETFKDFVENYPVSQIHSDIRTKVNTGSDGV